MHGWDILLSMYMFILVLKMTRTLVPSFQPSLEVPNVRSAHKRKNCRQACERVSLSEPVNLC